MEQHILIIEDDRTLNAGIAFALEKEGYAVHSALSLLEAEKRLDRKMNLILLDVNLPDGDGRDFLQNMLAGQPRSIRKRICCRDFVRAVMIM